MGEPVQFQGLHINLNHYTICLKQVELWSSSSESLERDTVHQISSNSLRGICDYIWPMGWGQKWHMSLPGWSVREQWEIFHSSLVSCHSDQRCSRWWEPLWAWILEWVSGELPTFYPNHSCWPSSTNKKYTNIFSHWDFRVNLWLQHKPAFWLMQHLIYLEWNRPINRT